MRLNLGINRKWMAAIFGGLLAGSLGLLLYETRFSNKLKRMSYDLLHVMRGDARATEAVLIYMDEPSYGALNQPLNAPWDRSLHARLVDRLTAAGARVIVFDIVFTDPMTSNPGADQQFADAMKRSGRVILAADNVQIESKHKRIFRPFDLLLSGAVDMGSAETMPDPDTVIRRHTPKGDADVIASLSWVAAEFLKTPITQQEGQEAAERWVHYYGPPAWLPSESYHRALDSAEVPDTVFRDKAVFIGGRLLTKLIAYRKDEYANPYSYWLSRRLGEGRFFSAGVEVQATMFLNLARGDWLRRPAPWKEHLIIVAAGVLFGMGLVRFQPYVATAVAFAGLAAVIAACYLLFVHQLVWFPWLIIAVQAGLALAWSVLFNAVQSYVEVRLLEHTLGVFLPPKLVKKFARDQKLLKPGAEKQIISIFFTDIADFTSLSQSLDSDELAKFMNVYFHDVVSNCIHKTDGTVVKYIGDAVFAFWNAPETQPDHALRACEAGLRLRDLGVSQLRGRPVHTRVGIHTGEANVGNFGSLERVDYTALGENVNLASRLEGLNKYVGTDCIISSETRAAIGDALITRRLGMFRLKGFDKPVGAHELVGWPDTAEPTRAWRDAFAEALGNYEAGHFEFAQLGFGLVLDLKPDDGPAKFYLERLEELSSQSPGHGWTGETQLQEK